MATKTGNSKYLREMNQALILDIIRTGSGVSRIAIAETTGLSPTAIGIIVKELIDEKYVYEVGSGLSSGGRKPMLLKLFPEYWHSLGIDIDAGFIYLTLVGIEGNVIWQKRENIDDEMISSSGQHVRKNTALKPINIDHKSHTGMRDKKSKIEQQPITPEDAVHIICRLIVTALEKSGISIWRILGIGISVPGIVDRETRMIAFAPNLQWRDVDFKDLLLEELGKVMVAEVDKVRQLQVFVENESVCSTICEKWLGSCKFVDDFVHINIDTGIGAGLFLKGGLYRGTTGSAGEVGHIIVEENGPLCTCGNYGCLETLASLDAMIKADGAISFQEFLQKLHQGNKKSIAVMKNASQSLGRAVSILVNTLNPRRIVLGKRFPEYADLALETVRDEVKLKTLSRPYEQVEVVAGVFGEESSSLGASILPIRHMMRE